MLGVSLKAHVMYILDTNGTFYYMHGVLPPKQYGEVIHFPSYKPFIQTLPDYNKFAKPTLESKPDWAYKEPM